MKAKAGRLFEEALQQAEIELTPDIEIKVKVKKEGKGLRLIVHPAEMTDFEADILERSGKISENLAPYRPLLPPGERIRSLRKAAGMTLADLAAKAEMSKGSLGSIEKGVRPSGMNVLRKIARAMDISVSVLVE